jgi:cobalt/nickel transport system permease protein
VGADKYAYASRLRRVEPLSKLAVTALGVALTLALDSVAVSALTVVLMSALNIKRSGVKPRALIKLQSLPLGFMLLACLTLTVGRFENGADALLGLRIGAAVYGVSAASLLGGLRILLKAMAIIACVYLFVLSTPVTDLALALRRLRVPGLFAELMELIYRFIFVLADTAARLRTAQSSRLGYGSLRASYRSIGILASMVFLRAYRKSVRIYYSLESRGYDGALVTAAQGYVSGRRTLLLGGAAALAQCAAWFLERAAIS